MGHRLDIERASDTEASEVEALLDSVAHWLHSGGIDQWISGTFHDEVVDVVAAGDLYVGKRDGRIVACFMLESSCPEWMVTWLAERGRSPADAMYLGRLAVTRNVAGQGLGVRLLEAATTIARDAGRTYVRLNAPANSTPLRTLYVDAGFDDLGTATLTGPKGEDWTCTVFERSTELT
jgi:GNAT superfamily N-acetyltransferase